MLPLSSPNELTKRLSKLINLQSLAKKLECQYRGDGKTEISAITTIDQTIKTGLSFLHDDRYAAHLAKAQGTVILSEK